MNLKNISGFQEIKRNSPSLIIVCITNDFFNLLWLIYLSLELLQIFIGDKLKGAVRISAARLKDYLDQNPHI